MKKSYKYILVNITEGSSDTLEDQEFKYNCPGAYER